jgi:hypothetical protein
LVVDGAHVIWWIIIPAGVAAALACAFGEHRTQSRHLVDLFSPLAETHGGHLKAASFLALPQLRFERDGRRYLAGAMATAGTSVSGSASRPGFSGPFTFVNVDIPLDTGQNVNILRIDRLDRGLMRLINTISNRQTSTTGDSAFDNTFRIKSTDQTFVHRVLDQALRQKLLRSPQQRLEVTLIGAKIGVHIDDYVKTADDLDEMIEIATLLAKNSGA